MCTPRSDATTAQLRANGRQWRTSRSNSSRNCPDQIVRWSAPARRRPTAHPWNLVHSKPLTRTDLRYPVHAAGAFMATETRIPSSLRPRRDLPSPKGDEVQVTGSKVTMHDTESIIAREVVKGGKTMPLRDKTGKPEWSGRGAVQPRPEQQ